MNRLILVGFGVLAIACGPQTSIKVSPTPSATTRVVPTTAPVPQSQVYKIGDKVEIYNTAKTTDIAVTVSDFNVVKDPNHYIEPSKGRFVAVTMTIENRANDPYKTSVFLNSELRDDSGQSYLPTYVPGVPQEPSGEIAPNDKLKGVTAYDVPTEGSFKLYVKADFLGTGQAVFDLGAPR